MRCLWMTSCLLLCLAGGFGRAASACPAVALGGCGQSVAAAATVVNVPTVIATSAVAVPSVVMTYAVPTIVATPTIVQQQVIVRQRPIRVRSRTVIRTRGFGLGIF
ncbi:MAG TPA: hypothetical protein VIK18_12455 [Pirellulales bacterium]